MEQVENGELKSKDIFVLMYEGDRGNLALKNVPTEDSCFQVQAMSQNSSRISSRSLIQMPCRSKSSDDLVVCS